MPSCRSLPPLSCWLAPLLLGAAVAVQAQVGADAAPPAALEARLQWAERRAAANPGDAQARFLVGVVLMDLQRDAEAMARFQELAQEFPELPDPQNNIALLHARAGRLEAARVALETALRNDPGHRLARLNLGHVHLMLAVQAWEQAAAAGPLEPAMQRTLEGARALLGPRPVAAR
ncbi:MAG: tetratricopeptide repeat protein [Rubrivivax sp.]|nr:tetratricopeptide repeat protein [Rubrivivax sp.]